VSAALAGFTAATGFNPAHDLEEILVATTGGPKDAPTLVLLRGIFDKDRVRAFAKNNGAQVNTYDGLELFSGVRNMGTERWRALSRYWTRASPLADDRSSARCYPQPETRRQDQRGAEQQDCGVERELRYLGYFVGAAIGLGFTLRRSQSRCDGGNAEID
jgi:hypothetical protein